MHRLRREPGAIQTMLGEAGGDARRVVGEAHYTGCRVRQELEKLELWLFRAPSQVLQELEAIRPGVYLIHNDAPRPRTAVDDLRDSFDWTDWKAEGVRARVSRQGPIFPVPGTPAGRASSGVGPRPAG